MSFARFHDDVFPRGETVAHSPIRSVPVEISARMKLIRAKAVRRQPAPSARGRYGIPIYREAGAEAPIDHGEKIGR